MVFCIKICWKLAVYKGGPGCAQLEREPDSQGTLVEAGWATSYD